MLRYLSLRVLYMLPVVWLVVSLVFLLIHLVPGDPILQMLGEGAPVTDVQAARHAYGLDLSLRRQYLNYWEGVLRGDLGPSLRFNQSVTRLISQRYPYTLQLTLAALLVALLLASFEVELEDSFIPTALGAFGGKLHVVFSRGSACRHLFQHQTTGTSQ